MKLSISLPEDDVAALDRFVETAGLPSRSAAVQHAVRLLGSQSLTDAYAEAWQEWHDSGDATDWETTSADGFSEATRAPR